MRNGEATREFVASKDASVSVSVLDSSLYPKFFRYSMIRIHHPKNFVASPTMRIEGIPRKRYRDDGSVEQRTTVWRKVEAVDGLLEASVELVFDERKIGISQDGYGTSRKRLKLLDTSTLANASKAATQKTAMRYRVLHPVERLVDDSLQQVALGTKTTSEHWTWCCHDPVFSSQRGNVYHWKNAAMGNILHGCALWNDAETIAAILAHRGVDVSKLSSEKDGDERTPYQVARLAGHDMVCKALEAYGADVSGYTEDYVADFYCIVDDHDEPEITDSIFYLQGATADWLDGDELVFESLVDQSEPIEDEDSNSENWEGNDYPDEEGMISYAPFSL